MLSSCLKLYNYDVKLTVFKQSKWPVTHKLATIVAIGD